MIERPDAFEHAPYQQAYIRLVPEGDLLITLREQASETARLWRGLTPEQADHRYAPGKWSVKEVAAHVIDTERVFVYRALRISRGDQTPLPGYDQDAYVAALDLGHRHLGDLAAELERLRASTLDFFGSLAPEKVRRRGEASGHALSVRAAAYVVAGHERHHVKILRERYL